MKIPFVDLYSPSVAVLTHTICEEIGQLAKTSQFILGEKVSEFEKRFAVLSATSFAVGVNSGLDALLLALRTLQLKNDDEVITVSNSFIASTSAIVLAGAKPVFVDVGEDYNLDPACLERVLSPKTRAILPVHLTGNPCRMDLIVNFAQAHGLIVIEDAAQAVGARFMGKAVGAWGDFGCFSLHPLKNLHVWGDGGMITTSSMAHAEKLRLQRNHGLMNRDEAEFFSYNSRLDSIQAVVGLALMELLGDTTKLRRRNAKIYESRLSSLSEKIKIPVVDSQKAEPVYHVFQVRAFGREKLKQRLFDCGVETKIHYPIPIHLQPASKYLGYKVGDLPMTETLAEEILSLPIRENLSADEIHYICDAIEGFYRNF